VGCPLGSAIQTKKEAWARVEMERKEGARYFVRGDMDRKSGWLRSPREACWQRSIFGKEGGGEKSRPTQSDQKSLGNSIRQRRILTCRVVAEGGVGIHCHIHTTLERRKKRGSSTTQLREIGVSGQEQHGRWAGRGKYQSSALDEKFQKREGGGHVIGRGGAKRFTIGGSEQEWFHQNP